VSNGYFGSSGGLLDDLGLEIAPRASVFVMKMES